MKKTINIHLSGIAFIVEEEAYESVKSYLDRLNKSLQNSPDSDEICADVEARIAELASTYLSDKKQILTFEDTQEILKTLGDPEEYIDNSEDEPETEKYKKAYKSSDRRLFRDVENASIAGVCSGLANYFSIDVIVVRILFVLFGLIGGFIVPLYIILWVVVPSAKSKVERLQMQGKPITVENLKEEFEDAATRIKKSSRKFEAEIRDKHSIVRSRIGRIGQAIGRVFGFFALVGGCMLFVSLLIGSFVPFEIFPFSENGNLLNFNDVSDVIFIDDSNAYYLWLSGFLALTSLALLFIVLGTTLLFNVKAKWMRPTYIFLIVFGTISVFASIYQGIKLGTDFTTEGITEIDRFQSADSTLMVSVLMNENMTKLSKNREHRDIEFSIDKDSVRFAGIPLEFDVSTDSLFHIYTTFSARGSSKKEATNRSKNITHSIIMTGNQLQISPIYTFPSSDKLRNQAVEITILIPKNRSVYIENQIINEKNIDDSGYFKYNGEYEHDARD